MAESRPSRVSPDVAATNQQIERFLNARDEQGNVVCNARYGVYAFYDFDGEPIYVGQTSEQLRVRIRRHLTNRRTDAVAMSILDPAEVAEVEVWPLVIPDRDLIKTTLEAAEFTVYQKVVRESAIGAVLNEKPIPARQEIQLPPSVRGFIIPDDIRDRLHHPDVRLARRATTVANLARIISERSVGVGIRRTLLFQTRRLERLAAQRLAELQALGDHVEAGDGDSAT